MRVACAGPESSGTQLLTHIVEALGVKAVHRSIPQGTNWDWMDTEDYDACVVIVRDMHPACQSAVRRRHAKNLDEAQVRYRLAIGKLAEIRCPWFLITYENLVQRPAQVIDEIATFLDISTGNFPGVSDENAKHYAEV